MKKEQKTTKKTKKLTIDDLAIMVAGGFAGMDKKFDKRFNEVDKRLDKMDQRFEKMEQTLYEMQSDMLTIKERLNKIEKVLEPLLLIVESIKIIQLDFENRISKLEKKVGVNK